jgi:hypothetical protein
MYEAGCVLEGGCRTEVEHNGGTANGWWIVALRKGHMAVREADMPGCALFQWGEWLAVEAFLLPFIKCPSGPGECRNRFESAAFITVTCVGSRNAKFWGMISK